MDLRRFQGRLSLNGSVVGPCGTVFVTVDKFPCFVVMSLVKDVYFDVLFCVISLVIATYFGVENVVTFGTLVISKITLNVWLYGAVAVELDNDAFVPSVVFKLSDVYISNLGVVSLGVT